MIVIHPSKKVFNTENMTSMIAYKGDFNKERGDHDYGVVVLFTSGDPLFFGPFETIEGAAAHLDWICDRLVKARAFILDLRQEEPETETVGFQPKE